jgi:predicted sugar kinase
MGLLPAIVEGDLATFSESLYDFNRRAGELFSPVQGGIYAHPRIEGIVKFIRSAGTRAVGQSSWGPTVFAIGLPDQLSSLRGRLELECGVSADEMTITEANCRGGWITEE